MAGEIRVQDEQGTIHVFPGEATPEMIAQTLGVKPPAPTATMKAAPETFSKGWWKEKLYNAIDATTETLPALGATGGAAAGAGVSGPPGAIGGAALGGMAGEDVKLMIRKALGIDSVLGENKDPQTAEDIAKDLMVQGAAQGGIQGVTEGLPVAGAALKTAAKNQYIRALGAAGKYDKAIARDIAPEMIQRGVVGSLEGIEKTATANADALRPELNAEYQALQGASPVLPVRNAQTGQMTAGTTGQIPLSGRKILYDLDQLKNRYIVRGQVADPAAINAIEGVQDIVRQYGPNLSPMEMRQLKQIFDAPVAKAGGYAGADLETQYALQAKEAAANSIRSILHNTPSDIAGLDQKISFWLDVKRVAGNTALRRSGQEGGLQKVFAPLAGGVAGAVGLVGAGPHGGLEAGAAATAVALAAQAMRSPAWRTTSAVVKDRLASALANESVADVHAILLRAGLAFAGNRASQPSSPAGTQGPQ
jgi:hypothetical protein